MNPVLASIKLVIEKSKHVSINETNLKKVCSKFNSDDVQYWMESSPFDLSNLNDNDRLNFIFVFNSINFCYWGNPKWTVKYQDNKYDGAWGMIASIKRAIDNNIPILDAKCLSKISQENLAEVLRGNIEIPLFQERHRILQEIGKVLLQKHKGQFIEILKKADGDALRLLAIITTDFPSYRDYAMYDIKKVFFYKRAQLAISDVHRTFNGEGFGNLKNINQLTAFADYKIPQSLRKLGVLEYSTELARKVDNNIVIPKGSEEEVEIRANMIWAIELMTQELKDKIPNITAMDIDSYLWLMGQNKSPNDKSYHLTKTTFY